MLILESKPLITNQTNSIHINRTSSIHVRCDSFIYSLLTLLSSVPQGLEDVSSYPTLFAELIGTGKWTIEDLKKLAGLNFLRVFQDVERVRDEFKKAKVPPYEDVLLARPKVNNCSSQDQF